MMKTGIYHTENSGIYLTGSKTGILIDGIHGGRNVGYSEMEGNTKVQIWNRSGIFRDLNGLLFTHLHIDHFDRDKVRAFTEKYPDIALWGPGIPRHCVRNHACSGIKSSFSIDEFTIRAYDTEHSGIQYRDERHCSFLIENRDTGETVFLSGDALLKPALVQSILSDVPHIDVIFIMVYQIVEEESKEFLKALDPGRIILYHNPEVQDDVHEQIPWTMNLIKQNPLPGHTIEIAEHRRWIE